jgi:uncharacterized protein with von Willebrand factor type A (vWA) domain
MLIVPGSVAIKLIKAVTEFIMDKIRKNILDFKAIKPKQIMDDKTNDGIPKIWTNLASSNSVIMMPRIKYKEENKEKINPIKNIRAINTFSAINYLTTNNAALQRRGLSASDCKRIVVCRPRHVF